MTKEELKLKAEESFEQYKVTDEDYVVSPYSDDMGEKMLMFNYEYEAEETYLRLYTQGYLAGAEPREKRIAELEHQLIHRNCLDCSNHSSKLRMRTLELEKENAELKETLKTYNGCGDWDNDFHTCRVYLQHEELQMYIDQLTKAKEIIKGLLSYEQIPRDCLKERYRKLLEEAEQFISGVEKCGQ